MRFSSGSSESGQSESDKEPKSKRDSCLLTRLPLALVIHVRPRVSQSKPECNELQNSPLFLVGTSDVIASDINRTPIISPRDCWNFLVKIQSRHEGFPYVLLGDPTLKVPNPRNPTVRKSKQEQDLAEVVDSTLPYSGLLWVGLGQGLMGGRLFGGESTVSALWLTLWLITLWLTLWLTLARVSKSGVSNATTTPSDDRHS